MNKLWRGISIFFPRRRRASARDLGVAIGFLHLPVCLPATCRLRAAFSATERTQADGVRHVHPCQPVRPRALWQGPRQRLRAHRLSRTRFRGRTGTGRSTSIWCRRRRSARPSDVKRSDVRRSRRVLRAFKGSQRYSIPDGVDLKELSERDHLVPAVRRSDLPRPI